MAPTHSGTFRRPSKARAWGQGAAHVRELLHAVQADSSSTEALCLIQPRRACRALAYSASGGEVGWQVLDRPLAGGLSVERCADEAPVSSAGQILALELGQAFERDRALDLTWLCFRDSAGLRAAIATERAIGEAFHPLLSRALLAAIDLVDVECELAALGALGSSFDAVLLFDCGSSRVIWASKAGQALSRPLEMESAEREIAARLPSLLQATPSDAETQNRPELALGVVHAAARLEDGSAPLPDCVALGLRAASDDRHGLSARESQVAEMLARGYRPANIAALTGVSEHTVRTYIRRAYKKLNVGTRAELVRRLLSRRTP